MGFDSTEHERSRGGTARSPETPDEEAADESIWNRLYYGFILICIGVLVGISGLNVVIEETGGIGPLSTVRLAAVGLVLVCVGVVAVGAVVMVRGTPNLQEWLPVSFDREILPAEPEDRDVEPGNWADLYLAVFLVYSLMFFAPGVLGVYEAATAESWMARGEILLGILFLLVGTLIVISALDGRDGDRMGLWINGGIAAVMSLAGVYTVRVDMAYGHDPWLGLVVLIPSVIGAVVTWQAYMELRTAAA
ncbi:hypothetical protein [Natrinema salinisoli]|uniref:hypothetical protein n=1 Tax=Natrinema salinisoli TaxID=2878535 RepID=UPI001CF04D58|nr:hypothetical protein [Natrinema salinisoli]